MKEKYHNVVQESYVSCPVSFVSTEKAWGLDQEFQICSQQLTFHGLSQEGSLVLVVRRIETAVFRTTEREIFSHAAYDRSHKNFSTERDVLKMLKPNGGVDRFKRKRGDDIGS